MTEDSGLEQDMLVIKRDETLQVVSFDKILNRIKNIGILDEKRAKLTNVNYTVLGMKVIDQLHDRIRTTKIDELTAEQCATMATTHPDYLTLAGRIIVSNHHKLTSSNFKQVISLLYNYKDSNGSPTHLISNDVYTFVMDHGDAINKMIRYDRDYEIDYFGFKTLERSYLMKGSGGTILERPQHMWMRVSLGIYGRPRNYDYRSRMFKPRPGNVSYDVNEIFYSRYSHTVQCRDSAIPAQFVLLDCNGTRQY
jgi:hypothetical protein